MGAEYRDIIPELSALDQAVEASLSAAVERDNKQAERDRQRVWEVGVEDFGDPALAECFAKLGACGAGRTFYTRVYDIRTGEVIQAPVTREDGDIDGDTLRAYTNNHKSKGESRTEPLKRAALHSLPLDFEETEVLVRSTNGVKAHLRALPGEEGRIVFKQEWGQNSKPNEFKEDVRSIRALVRYFQVGENFNLEAEVVKVSGNPEDEPYFDELERRGFEVSRQMRLRDFEARERAIDQTAATLSSLGRKR